MLWLTKAHAKPPAPRDAAALTEEGQVANECSRLYFWKHFAAQHAFAPAVACCFSSATEARSPNSSRVDEGDASAAATAASATRTHTDAQDACSCIDNWAGQAHQDPGHGRRPCSGAGPGNQAPALDIALAALSQRH